MQSGFYRWVLPDLEQAGLSRLSRTRKRTDTKAVLTRYADWMVLYGTGSEKGKGGFIRPFLDRSQGGKWNWNLP